MIVKKIICICPVCDEVVSVNADDVLIEHMDDEIFVTFPCTKCGEYLDKEAWETE